MFTMTRAARRAMLLAATAAAGSLLLAGCSSTDTTPTPGGGVSIDTSVAYTPEAAQSQLDLAYIKPGSVKLGDLPQEVQDALGRSSVELTAAQKQKALDCWKQPSCDWGDGPVHLGIFNAVDNLWQTTAVMDVLLQAATYPEVGQVSYSFVSDLPSAQAAVRSMVADGANLIIGYNAFGAAMAPAFSDAQAAGAKVVTYTGETPGVDAAIINNQVVFEVQEWGKQVADMLTHDLGLSTSDDIAFFFGTPGNPQDTLIHDALQAQLQANGGPKIAFTQDTDWTRPGVAAAATALIASGIDAKAVVNSYDDPIPQLITAYDQAGLAVPTIVSWTELNDLFGTWESRLGTPKQFDLYYTTALVWTARVALSDGMKLLAGENVPARTGVPLPIVKADKGIYEPTLPGDFPGWSALIPEDVMNGMLNR